MRIKATKSQTNYPPKHTLSHKMVDDDDVKDGTPFAALDIGDPPPKKRSGGRTDFDPTAFTTSGLFVGMAVEDFFRWCIMPFNMNSFITERDNDRVERRKPIWSLMRFVELLYPDVGKTCTTEFVCLQHLIASHRVMELNFIVICENLQHLLTGLCRPFIVDGVERDKPGAHATVISAFRGVFKAKSFWTPELDIEVKKVFGIVPEHLAKIRVINATRVETNLKNIKQLEYNAFKKFILAIEKKRLESERSLRDDDLSENKRKKLKRTIIICACIIVQTMTARRIIEVLRVSRFVASTRDGFITVIGLAKTRAVAQESTVHEIDAAADDDEDEDAPADTTKTIDIPIMLLDWTGTPFSRNFLLTQVDRIRALLLDLYPDIAKYTNSQVTARIVGPMYTITSKIWDVHEQALVKGTISHLFRKASASMSFFMCGEGRAAPSWYMYVLGHANIFISLNYMNIVLYNFPSLHNDERDRKYNELNDKHDRDMVEMRRLMDTKQDRKRRRDYDESDDEPDDEPDDAPDDAPDAPDAPVIDIPRGVELEISSDDDFEIVFEDGDDDLVQPPIIAVRTVNVPRIGGGMIDVPVYVREYHSELRPRLTSAQRDTFDMKEIVRLRNGPWAEMDVTQMFYKDFDKLEIPRLLWKQYRKVI